MNDQFVHDVILALIAIVPACTTVLTSLWTNRLSKKHAAKQSILQMIMEDQLSYELFGRFPQNYGDIQDEYKVYHENGGNGEVTKRVDEYNRWYYDAENNLIRPGQKHVEMVTAERGIEKK